MLILRNRDEVPFSDENAGCHRHQCTVVNEVPEIPISVGTLPCGGSRRVRFNTNPAICNSNYFVIQDKQDSQQSRKTKFLWSKPFWMADEKLVRSRVFMVKLNKAASRIQSFFKGIIARKLYRATLVLRAKQAVERIRNEASTLIQSAVRRYQGRMVYSRIISAVKVQSSVRAWMTRSHFLIVKLRNQLESIENRRQQDFRMIEEYRKERILEIHQLYADRDAQTAEAERKVLEARLVVESLQKHNKKLRLQNSKLQNAIKHMARENQLMELRALSADKEARLYRIDLQRLSNENKQWTGITLEMQQRKKGLEDALYEVNELIEFEGQVGGSVKNHFRQMMKHIQENCRDRLMLREVFMGGLPKEQLSVCEAV